MRDLMNLKDFFKPINDKKVDVAIALKKYIEAIKNFYRITGLKYSDTPKSKGQQLGFDDLMINIEDLHEQYLELRNEYKILYNFYLSCIKKVNSKSCQLIIEYAFLNNESDKQLSETLKEYHKIEYSDTYIRKIKLKASNEMLKVIDEKMLEELNRVTKGNKLEQKGTKRNKR